MVVYSEVDLKLACARVFKLDVLPEGMCRMIIVTVQMAGATCFAHKLEGPDPDIIRQALLDAEFRGHFNYST